MVLTCGYGYLCTGCCDLRSSESGPASVLIPKLKVGEREAAGN